jgi:NADH-quinone oxidoreductase subunit J
MSVSAIIFYILATWILATAIMSVTSRKIFRSAIYLLGTLVGIAGIYFWMEMEFVAAIQIVVYVGGIVVLIIFSIFLTQQSGKEMPRTPLYRNIASILATFLGFLLTIFIIRQHSFIPSGKPFDNSVERIGTLMLNTGEGGYVLPFETISILLLAAMIGCIVIALKQSPAQK